MRPWISRTLLSAMLLVTCALVRSPDYAWAQEAALFVNGDAVTSVDIEQRMKLLRAIHKPASRDAAIESMVETRLKAHEVSNLGLNITDAEVPQQIQTDARRMGTSAQALANSISAAGVSQDHMLNYFKVRLAYSVLIKALNKGVEASEVAVRQEMAKEKSKNAIQQYTLRQVVFTVSPGDGPAALEAAAKQAEALRGRFTSCATGLPYAKSLPGVAIREPLTRSSSSLPDGIKEVLEKTPIGHLTSPSRSPNGIELIAVCNRSSSGADDELRKNISDRLLSDHLAQQEAAKYKELRARAIIQRVR